MKNFVIASLGSLVAAGVATAGFGSIVFDEYQSEDGTKCIADIYVAFTDADDVLLNLFNVVAELEGGFDQLNHKDLVPGGTWSPQFTMGDGASDSFVTIGGVAGFANSSSADPNWGAAGFNQLGIPALAGWFNSNPPNLQGQSSGIDVSNLTGTKTYTGAGTFIMRLAIDKSLLSEAGLTFSFNGSLTFNQGLGTDPVQPAFTFENQLWAIPAPGALALLGLAGLAGGRRRRA